MLILPCEIEKFTNYFIAYFYTSQSSKFSEFHKVVEFRPINEMSNNTFVIEMQTELSSY